MSFGEELRRERELRQISLREISEATKINLRYLDALEHNDFRHLPGGVFNKGFVKAFAQHIGVDPEAMVNAYLLEERSQREAGGEAPGDEMLRGTRVRQAEPEPEDPGPARGRRLWLGAAVLAVAVTAAAVLTLLGVVRLRPVPESADEAPAATAAAPPPEPAPLRETGETGGGTSEEAPPAGEAVEAEPAGAPDPPTVAEVESEPAGVPDSPTPAPAAEQPARPAPRDPAPAEVAEPVLEAHVVLIRPTSGQLVCDDRQVETLQGMTAGETLHLTCKRYLEISVRDGGALLVGTDGAAPAPIGADGVPVVDRRLTPPRAPRRRGST